MNVSIYDCALNIVDILAAFCVFQFSRTALNNNNNNNKNNPTPLSYELQAVSLRGCSGVGTVGTA